jgi:hypothetical protein
MRVDYGQTAVTACTFLRFECTSGFNFQQEIFDLSFKLFRPIKIHCQLLIFKFVLAKFFQL